MRKITNILRTWEYLSAQSKKGEVVTYGQVANEIWGNSATNLVSSNLLKTIQAFCQNQNMPDLSILVVKISTKIPGDGFYKLYSTNVEALSFAEKKKIYDEQKENVFSYDFSKDTGELRYYLEKKYKNYVA